MSKYQVVASAKFRRDLKAAKKRGYDMALLDEVVSILAAGEALPPKNHDHALVGGKFKGCRECHILPDWLLVYEIRDTDLVLYLTHTGTHSDLFGK